MSEQRDWDSELAKIDKLIAKMPPGPPATRGGPEAPAAESESPSPARLAGRTGRLTGLTTWLRVGLGLVLAVAITQWPYPSACGLNLAVYLGAILTVVIAGGWSAITSWQRRLGVAHVLSLLVLLWGLLLTAREVLPRVGYARTTATWFCP